MGLSLLVIVEIVSFFPVIASLTIGRQGDTMKQSLTIMQIRLYNKHILFYNGRLSRPDYRARNDKYCAIPTEAC